MMARGQLERGAEHQVGHPQFVGQGTLEGLGGTARGRRQVSHGMGVQLMVGQQPIDRGHTEGAFLEHPLLEELAHQHLDPELGIFFAPLHEALALLRTERLTAAFVFAHLTVQGFKALVAPIVIPAFQRGGGISLAAPAPLAGQSRDSGQREVLL